MKIGIIGAGNIGGTLTRRFCELGHDVYVANSRGPETLEGLAKVTGAKPVTAKEAAHSGDLVVVTIPERAIMDLPDDLFDGVSDDVVVVDTCNYYPRQRDGRIEAIEEGMTESGWVAQQLGRPVVKAFNNIQADHLMNRAKPEHARHRIALPVAGDRPRDKQIVMDLVNQLGFDPVDAGSLDDSWRQQPGTPVYVADLDAKGVRDALEEAEREREPAFSGTEASPGTFVHPA